MFLNNSSLRFTPSQPAMCYLNCNLNCSESWSTFVHPSPEVSRAANTAGAGPQPTPAVRAQGQLLGGKAIPASATTWEAKRRGRWDDTAFELQMSDKYLHFWPSNNQIWAWGLGSPHRTSFLFMPLLPSETRRAGVGSSGKEKGAWTAPYWLALACF